MMGRPIPRSPEPAPNPRAVAQALVAQKDDIEKELRQQGTILVANGCDMTTPLVDSEGFPRADIDVYAVRYARVRIIELRNDLKAIMDRISVALEDVYNAAHVEESSEAQPQADGSLQPFARVDGVAPGSPAAEAGLQRDDQILQFGSLTFESFTGSLQPLASLVESRENRQIVIRVRRQVPEQHDRDLNFTPRKWGGRGLLGCHIVPT